MEPLKSASARHLLKWPSVPMRPRNWVCQSCRTWLIASSSRRLSATATAPASPSKPFYVTTPIFYVNAIPHVGHMSSMILADVLKRWQVLSGKQALLCTGTDEHGLKVQQAAAAESMPPMQWCDHHASKFKELADSAQIDYDRFIRTTDRDHVQAVEHFWLLLRDSGYIYQSKHEGWYCVSDECFYPESLVRKAQDPFTGEVFMASVETGKKVEWVEEKNYHFRMTALKDKLLKFFEENPEWVVPASRMNEVVDWVKNHLEDLSISRPSKRLTWGIPVPGDESQTIYVWVDALINYITYAGFPSWTPGRQYEGGWPADVHVIGKDILRFHCVYWPALLLALDLPLPKRILSHAHWTMSRQKMSKSSGNAVNPYFALERFGVDAMRFYMIHDCGIANDADYSNTILADRYKTLLQARVGNLLRRVAQSYLWRHQDIVEFGHRDQGTQVSTDKIHELSVSFRDNMDGLVPTVIHHMEQLNPSAALQSIMAVLGEANKFVSDVAPWDLMKREESVEAGKRSLFLLSEALRVAGILLQPFMPSKAGFLLDTLGVSTDKRTLEHAVLYSDSEYHAPPAPKKGAKNGPRVLFPPLPPVEDEPYRGIRGSKLG